MVTVNRLGDYYTVDLKGSYCTIKFDGKLTVHVTIKRDHNYILDGLCGNFNDQTNGKAGNQMQVFTYMLFFSPIKDE